MRDRLPEMSDIHAFLLVAEELSFRKAADRLLIDQSVLSRRIRNFEERIGFSLFFRTTRDVVLTEPGRVMLSRLKPMFGELGHLLADARSVAEGTTGRLRMAYMSFAATRLMPHYVKQFSAAHPKVSLELNYMPTMQQKIAIELEEIDVGLMLGPVDHPDLDSLIVAEEQMTFVARHDHPLVRRSEITMQDVALCPLVLGDTQEWELFRKILERPFKANGLKLSVAYQASNAMGIMGLVVGGLGATIFVESIEAILPVGLVARPIADCRDPVTTVLCWKRGQASPALRHLLGIARPGSKLKQRKS